MGEAEGIRDTFAEPFGVWPSLKTSYIFAKLAEFMFNGVGGQHAYRGTGSVACGRHFLQEATPFRRTQGHDGEIDPCTIRFREGFNHTAAPQEQPTTRNRLCKPALSI